MAIKTGYILKEDSAIHVQPSHDCMYINSLNLTYLRGIVQAYLAATL